MPCSSRWLGVLGPRQSGDHPLRVYRGADRIPESLTQRADTEWTPLARADRLGVCRHVREVEPAERLAPPHGIPNLSSYQNLRDAKLTNRASGFDTRKGNAGHTRFGRAEAVPSFEGRLVWCRPPLERPVRP